MNSLICQLRKQAVELAVTTGVKRHMSTSLRLEHGVKSLICQLRKQAAELAVTTAVKSPTGHQPEAATWSEVPGMPAEKACS